MKTTALAMLVLRTPRGALVRARVEPTPHGDAPCSICEALDEHLEYAGVINVRVGADCAICGSIVHHVSGRPHDLAVALRFSIPPGQPEAGQ